MTAPAAPPQHPRSTPAAPFRARQQQEVGRRRGREARSAGAAARPAARRAGVSRSPAPGAAEPRPRVPEPRPRRRLGLVPGRSQPVRGPSRHDVGRVAAALRGRGAPGTPGLRRHRPLRKLLRYGEGAPREQGLAGPARSSEGWGWRGPWLGEWGRALPRRRDQGLRGWGPGRGELRYGRGREQGEVSEAVLHDQRSRWAGGPGSHWHRPLPGMPEKPAAPTHPRTAWGLRRF